MSAPSRTDSSALDALVEDLAAAVVMADASDAASLTDLRRRLGELEPLLGADETLQRAVREALAHLAAATASEATAVLQVVGRLVEQVQKQLPQLERGAQPQAAAPSAPAAAAGPVERDAETVELLGEFLGEAEDGLAKADQILMAVEKDGLDKEKVNALFRTFHSMKGLAACLDVPDVTSLAHTTETLLNRVRDGALALDGAALERVFEATGAMRDLLTGTRAAVEQGVSIPRSGELPALLARIESASAGQASAVQKPAPVQPEPALKAEPSVKGEAPVKAEAPAPAPAKVAEPAAEPPSAARAPAADDDAHERAESAPSAAAAASGGAKLRETVKVDLERVESVVEMIGELIIVESMVVNAPEITGLQSLKVRNYLGQLTKISRDLQDVAMRMRMVPVRGVFQKMARMVRDLSRVTGKRAVLEQVGEGTEMDRSMVERIEEPLVHMIRNSMDHGVEDPAERTATGKPETATLRLSAFHEGGNIVIEVADDGRGLNRAAIVKKALAQGLIQSADGMSDAEVYDLIFAPGFSTKQQVTELSGRGVGMDVVKKNIEAMRGRVVISSTPGRGTTFRLMLPLTLAIIDGMLVSVGSERYIVPSLSIVESLQPRAEMLSTLGGREEFINVRGDLLPLLRVSRLLEVDGAQQDPTQALVVVVETLGRRVGLLVDDVVAQQQVVIKPVGSGLHHVEWFSGAAILSDGKVGLILNIDRISMLFSRRTAGRFGLGSSEAA